MATLPACGSSNGGIVLERAVDDAVLAALAEVIAHIGDERFPARVARLLEHLTQYESAVFVCYFTCGLALPLFSNLSHEDERRTLDPYFNGVYLLDPWYQMVLEGASDGVYRLSDCAPEDFTRTEYYRAYYANLGLQDERAVFVRLNDSTGLVLSVGTREGRRALESGFQLLCRMVPCIRSLCVRHWGGVSASGQAAVDSLAQRCGQRGLSEREIEVTVLLLRGCSNKVIARKLDISPETVKVHRKRINKKLGTSSTRDVFARFFPTLRLEA